MSELNGRYEVKSGDTLWKVAKEQLKATGTNKPTNAQIIAAMNKIAQANGCEDYQSCKEKYFNKVGSELNITGLFVESTADKTFVDFDDGAIGKKEDANVKSDTLKTIQLTSEDLKKIKDEISTTNLNKLSEEDLKKILDTINRQLGKLDVTYALGENGDAGVTTKSPYEEGGQMTTMALGEEGGTAVTYALGENGDGATTKSIGEEGGQMTTMALGEEGGDAGLPKISDEKIKEILDKLKQSEKPSSPISTINITEEDLKKIIDAINKRRRETPGLPIGATTKSLGEEGGTSVTYALGENGDAGVTTKSPYEEGGQMTTMALGEEGGTAVTYALGENGDAGVTTKSPYEEGGQMTTMALGEEGGTVVTYALGENGGEIKLTPLKDGKTITFSLNENGEK